MPGPVREHIAAVRCEGRQGSGYLLAPRLVLTAAHVVGERDVARVITLGGRGELRCSVIWTWEYEGVDIALLAADEDLLRPPAAALFRAVRWGTISSLAPIAGCQAIGFPQVQRNPDGHLDSEQLVGTFKPGTGLVDGRYALDSDHPAPAPRPDSTSPWAGMSGAAVFAGDLLVGVVAADPHGWLHGRLTVTPVHKVLEMPRFLGALDAAGCPAPAITSASGPVGGPHAEFELRYAEFLARRHSRLTIFGIDLSSRSRASWPLDAAYVSLETTSPERTHEDGIPLPTGPRPADQALAGHDRVLLRGVAGSGKTTLVQWLTVKAVADGSSGRIPFVLPLRTLIRRNALPMPTEFLSAVRAPITPPPGWAERVLTAGRGLLLVDGLDEVGERERERVRDWLRDLLIAFPGNQWMVTTRPSAVEESWLAREGFADLTLAPMNRADVTAFVERWHDAARATENDEDELTRLDAYQVSLHQALRTKQDLARLATNPLMCGLICALHRDRHGYLPHGRKELYEAALSMLLARRDRERDLPVQLTEEPQIQLIQKLAYWMIRNGQAEMEQSDAIGLIDAALPSMPVVGATLGDARQVFRHLLERSGLLREPTEGIVDFIHRTFQDYLGAKAAVEERDFDLMVRNAHHDQWSDVIRMATAHARPAERARLLRKLIARGDRTPTYRARLHLLAMACLEHAPELDPAVREQVNLRTNALIPPRTVGEATALAAVGPVVLELLPGPEGLENDEAEAVVFAAATVGTEDAIPTLARFRHHADLSVQSALASCWGKFEDEPYVSEILRHLDRGKVFFPARSPKNLRTLSAMGALRIEARGALSPQELRENLDPKHLTALELSNNPDIEDLGFLGAFARLAYLGIFGCTALRDLNGLSELTGLETLRLRGGTTYDGLARHPVRASLTELWMPPDTRSLGIVTTWPRLCYLEISGYEGPAYSLDWASLSKLAELTTIAVNDSTVRAWADLDHCLPRITGAYLSVRKSTACLADVAACLPGLEWLSLYAEPGTSLTVDLEPLAELAGLRTVRAHRWATVLNADAIPRAEVTVRPRGRT